MTFPAYGYFVYSLRAAFVTETELILEASAVRTILEGRKTQARAIIEPQPLINKAGKPYWRTKHNTPQLVSVNACPLGKMGDKLWVREAYTIPGPDGMDTFYRVTHLDDAVCYDVERKNCMGDKLSFAMDIIGIKVDRLQNISYAECKAEGHGKIVGAASDEEKQAARDRFRRSWNSQNGFASWEKNPWVWVLSFYPTSMWVTGDSDRNVTTISE